MRDNDTKILEEAYYSDVYKRHRSSGAANTLATFTKEENGRKSELVDVSLDIEYDIYRGSTPPQGDDPNEVDVQEVTVAEDYLDDKGNIIIPAGTNIKELEDQGWSTSDEDIYDAAYQDAFGLT